MEMRDHTEMVRFSGKESMGERSQSKVPYLLLPPVTLRTRYDNALPLARWLQWADAPRLIFCCRFHGRPRDCAPGDDGVSLYSTCNSDNTVPSSANSAVWVKAGRNLFRPISYGPRRLEDFLLRQERVSVVVDSRDG
jgi:hypothetical protein